MKLIQYPLFDQVAPGAFLAILNKARIRTHLIDHPQFTLDTVSAWVKDKLALNAQPGSKVRAILVDNTLAGWCAIQWDGEGYELAIVLDENYWGLGKKVFKEVLNWSKAIGHKEVRIHLLDTRAEYRFLKAMAKRVYKSELMGRTFTTYELEVV